MESSESALRPIHSFFNHPGLRKFWLKARFIIVLVAIAFMTQLADPKWFWIGLTISLLGEFFQLWCWSTLRTSKSLAYLGPYSMVRNPMYLGRYFIVLGVILLAGMPGVWFIIPYTLIYGFYMVNRVRREEKKLTEMFGEDYLDYCSKVNRFLPSFRGFNPDTVFSWNWDTFHENHGVMNLVGLLAIYAIFYLFIFVL